MSQEFSAFSSVSPFDPSNASRSQLAGRTVQTTSPSVLPAFGPHGPTGQTAPDKAPFSPEQQLRAITEFIDDTSRLSATQLQWLAFMEHWVEPTKYHDLDERIEATIDLNMQILAEAVMELTRQGKPLKIGHPQTGQSVPVIGMSYSTEQLGYQVAIPGTAATAPTFMPLFTSDQLHL
jgi:hypothetical protein